MKRQNQVRLTEGEANGKTIAKVFSPYSDVIHVVFTDGTFARIESYATCYHCDVELEGSLSDVDLSLRGISNWVAEKLCENGIITNDEKQEVYAENKKLDEKNQQLERKEYERLKAKFEASE